MSVLARTRNGMVVTEYVVIMVACMVAISLLLAIAIPGEVSLAGAMAKAMENYLSRISAVLAVP